MNKVKKLSLSILLLVSLAGVVNARMQEFSPDTTFLDFEDLLRPFKKRNKQTVHVIDNQDSPVKILSADLGDRGTAPFKDLTDAVDTYRIKVKNLSGRPILSYEVTWTLRHPFEDYTYKKVTANSIDLLKSGASQKLEFRRDKYFRNDAYYYVEITKVEFNDDESVWEAPEHEETFSEMDAIKKEIDSIKEKDINDMTKEEVLEKTDGEVIKGSEAEDKK